MNLSIKENKTILPRFFLIKCDTKYSTKVVHP